MAEFSGFEGFSMLELYRSECETQVAEMNKTAALLEQATDPIPLIQALMRSAHSLKGAARMVGIDAAVRIAHRLEDYLTILRDARNVTHEQTDVVMAGVDLMALTATLEENGFDRWQELHGEKEERFIAMMSGAEVTAPSSAPSMRAPQPQAVATEVSDSESKPAGERAKNQVLRLTASSLDRLTSGTGEALVVSRRLERAIAEGDALRRAMVHARRRASAVAVNDDDWKRVEDRFVNFVDQIERMGAELTRLLTRAYDDAQACRMVPFGQALRGMPRLVRDVARQTNKNVTFVLEGEWCMVDREVLEQLEAPLGHLVRNAIDHGIETEDERVARGKPPAGKLTISAYHRGGRQIVRIEDNGRGLDFDNIRRIVVERSHASAEVAAQMSPEELAEFLFLPGFTLAGKVTVVSGRGAGLDAVMLAVRELGGRIRTTSEPGKGTAFELVLPLSLSVVPLLLFRCAGNLYGLPLPRAGGVKSVPRNQIESTGGRQHVVIEDRRVSLVSLAQILELPRTNPAENVPVILVEDGNVVHGLAAEKLEGMAPASMRPIDPRLGKVADVSCVGVLDDGRVVIVLDQEDIVRSVHRILHSESVDTVSDVGPDTAPEQKRRKRILVVDDSLTVRELERKMLAGRGYVVEVAVDGIEAWNALRSRDFDLLVTDIDMPRLDGFGLVERVRQDARLKRLPTMIVSYKDREEDRLRGLEVGADHYLTKGAFHDEKLIEAVRTLVGEPLA